MGASPSYRDRWSAGSLGVLLSLVLVVAGCGSGTPTAVPFAPDLSQAPHSIVRSDGSPSGQPNAFASTVDGLPGEPDPALTPGVTNPAVTQANIQRTICTSGWTATVRPSEAYTTALKRTQIVAYGHTDRTLADYEEDHLISLEIGGAPQDPRNLWPEPYTVKLSDGRSVGARVKDLIENRLHDLVCAGTISLATAQHEEATEWVTAWFALDGQAPPPGIAAIPTPAPTSKPTSKPTPKPASGTLKVKVTNLTSPVSAGEDATVRIRTRAGASCSIVVRYKSGPSKAQGLGPLKVDGYGAGSWTWLVGSRTTHGSWPITITCVSARKSASAHATLVVS